MKCDQCKKQMSARDTVRELIEQYAQQFYLQITAPKDSEMRIALEGVPKRIVDDILDFVEQLSPKKETDCDMVGHY